MILFLFIFESIGTSELILIGIIALIFLGPRKLPEIAKKMGKIMADFRNTTNEFKETWEREVNFEEEAKAIRTGDLEETQPSRLAAPNGIITDAISTSTPEVKAIDPAAFNQAAADAVADRAGHDVAADGAEPILVEGEAEPEPPLSDKKNWL